MCGFCGYLNIDIKLREYIICFSFIGNIMVVVFCYFVVYCSGNDSICCWNIDGVMFIVVCVYNVCKSVIWCWERGCIFECCGYCIWNFVNCFVLYF